MEPKEQTSQGGLRLTQELQDQLLAMKPVLRPNRHQQLLLGAAGLALLLLLVFPPWMTVVEGREQFLGFYPLFGGNPQAAFHIGTARVFLHTQLLGLLGTHIFLTTVFLFSALSLTSEDWAATLARHLRDISLASTADTPGLVRAAEKTVRVVREAVPSFDWSFSRVPVESEPLPKGRPVGVERMIVQRVQVLIAQGRHPDAERLLRRSLDPLIEVLDDAPAFAGDLAFRLANLLRDRGSAGEAEDFYLLAIDIQERTLGERDLTLASTLRSYARLLASTGRDDVAVHLEAIARDIREERGPRGVHPVPGDIALVPATDAGSLPVQQSLPFAAEEPRLQDLFRPH